MSNDEETKQGGKRPSTKQQLSEPVEPICEDLQLIAFVRELLAKLPGLNDEQVYALWTMRDAK